MAFLNSLGKVVGQFFEGRKFASSLSVFQALYADTYIFSSSKSDSSFLNF